jgi:hypothetical protein
MQLCTYDHLWASDYDSKWLFLQVCGVDDFVENEVESCLLDYLKNAQVVERLILVDFFWLFKNNINKWELPSLLSIILAPIICSHKHHMLCAQDPFL